MRGDWAGAESLLKRISSQADMPAGVALNTIVLRGIINEQTERSGIAFFKSARNLSSVSGAASELLLMGLIAEIERQKESAVKLREELSSESVRFT